MDSIQLDIDDGYDKQCGEMFLTLKGNIVFHCTLCDNKYEMFEHYADHVLLLHYIESSNLKQTIKDEVQPSQLNDDDHVLVPKVRKKKPPPLSELMTKLFDDSGPQDEATIKQEASDEEVAESQLIESQPNTSSNNLETLDIKVEFSDADFSDNESAIDDSINEQPALDSIKYLFECSQCSAVFTTPEELENHTKEEHLPSSIEPSDTYLEIDQNVLNSSTLSKHDVFVCEYCGKGFSSSLELKDHIEYYSNNDHKQCNYCQTVFESSTSLHRHMGVHYHERHYECNICRARFKKQRGLNEHQRVHRNHEHKFACKQCNKKFQLKAGLKWHMRRKHQKTLDKNHGSIDDMEVHLGSHVNVMISAALL